MASVTKLTTNGRNGYRVRFYDEKQRREIYLAAVSKRVAETVGRYCDDLSGAKGAGVQASTEAMKWANEVEGKIREKLVEWGLADPISPKLMTDEGRLLGPFVDAYIESRTDWAPNTVANAKQVTRLLKQNFGERKPLKAITAADAERWQRWLVSDQKLAEATVSKHVKRAKTMFANAVRDRLLAESPFAGLKAGSESNPERQRFIKADVITKVIDACPDADWRLIFTLCRYAGLRCPTEVLGLRWSDVNWEAGKLRIDSVKTGLRFCPLFPEIREALGESRELAPDGAMHCITRYRCDESNLRTQAHRIIERAGHEPWPKLFVNLRSTRRTELQESFPSHVVNAWLGHSEKVAERHYLQVTDEHWGRAVESGTPTRSPITARRGPSATCTDTKKARENRAFDASGCTRQTEVVPPQGLEQASKTLGKVGLSVLVPPHVPPSLDGCPIASAELIEIWNGLDDAGRADLLAVARGLRRER